jgi:hypothetical protein
LEQNWKKLLYFFQEVRYTGGPAALQITMETKEKLQKPFQLDQPDKPAQPGFPEELPPPYAEVQPSQNPYL